MCKNSKGHLGVSFSPANWGCINTFGRRNMSLLRQFTLSSAVLLTCAAPALAVQVSNQPQFHASKTTTSSVVERGGTVDAVDTKNGTIAVDGVKYTLSSSPVAIHASSGTAIKNAAELTAGTTIRFNTSKQSYSTQGQVNEIWVVGPIKKLVDKKPIRNTPGKNKPGNP